MFTHVCIHFIRVYASINLCSSSPVLFATSKCQQYNELYSSVRPSIRKLCYTVSNLKKCLKVEDCEYVSVFFFYLSELTTRC